MYDKHLKMLQHNHVPIHEQFLLQPTQAARAMRQRPSFLASAITQVREGATLVT